MFQIYRKENLHFLSLLNIYRHWLKFFFPFGEIAEPVFSGMIAESLVVTSESDGIFQFVGRRCNYEGIVVVVGLQFLFNMLARDADAESHGFLLVCEGVFAADGIVGTPASAESFLVREFLRAFHVDDSR